MGEIILNGKSYISGMKYKEVTQAEYNALPSSKLTDGTLYCITDAPGPGEGFPPMIYSYEEREVGVWVDGKPLYQKTIDFGTLPNNTTKTVAHNINSVNGQSFCKIEVIVSTSTTGYSTFQRVHDRDVKYQAFWEVTSTDIICYSRENDNSGYVRCFITLYYTKTTDTPGSSEWNVQGTFNSIDVTEHVKTASGITLNSNFSYKAVKTGNIVTLSASGSIDSGAAAVGTNYNLFTVDDVIAPIANGTMYCYGAGSSNARVAASTNKNISITGGGWCSFTVNWISR